MLALQANSVIHALQDENRIRESHTSGVDVVFSLRDLQLGAIGNLKVIVPGRRRQLILGEQGSSLYSYKAVFMDAKNQTGTFAYHCGVFIVPKVCYILSIHTCAFQYVHCRVLTESPSQSFPFFA